MALDQGSATYGPRDRSGPSSKIITARRPFKNCSNCIAHLVVFHFMNLPSLQLLLLYIYEEILMRNRTVL